MSKRMTRSQLERHYEATGVHIDNGIRERWAVSFPPYLSCKQCSTLLEAEAIIQEHIDLAEELAEERTKRSGPDQNKF